MNEHINIKYTVDYIKIDQVNLALHSWLPKQMNAIIFYLHGIQSHAGWLHEFSRHIATHNIATFVLDRRGAGISEGTRYDIASKETLFHDYLICIKKIRKQFPDIKLTILGHCLGGSLLAGLLCFKEISITIDNVVFCSTGLGRIHQQLAGNNYPSLASESNTLINLNLNDEDFTDTLHYLMFMKNDAYCNRFITKHGRSVLYEIETLYYARKNVISIPAAYVYGRIDPVIDIPPALEIFDRLTGGNGVTLQLPAEKHYLLFTQQKHLFINWLATYSLTNGYTQYD